MKDVPGSTQTGGTPNAPRKSADRPRREDDNLHVPFSNIEQGRQTGLQRQCAGAELWRRHNMLPAKLADDRIDGQRWSHRQIERRYDDQARRALRGHASFALKRQRIENPSVRLDNGIAYSLSCEYSGPWPSLFVGRHSERCLLASIKARISAIAGSAPSDCLTSCKRSAKVPAP